MKAAAIAVVIAAIVLSLILNFCPGPIDKWIRGSSVWEVLIVVCSIVLMSGLIGYLL